jgi:hypothetical protein
MSKMVQAVIIGFVVAFVVGGGLSFLLAFDDQPHPVSPLFAGAVAGMLAAFIFANLAGNRSIANASAEDQHAALARTPAAGKALLYVARRGYVAKLVGMNFALDGMPVAQLKSPRFTCIALPAGPHILTAIFGGFAQGQAKPGECVFTAPADGVVVITAGLRWGLVKGGIGLTLEPDAAGARTRLAGVPMTPPDVAEV